MLARTDDPNSRRSGSIRTLVVDDDPTTLIIVGSMLKVLGFQVDSAKCGLSARHRLHESRYDVLVTDLQMPGMDGYSLASWLRQESMDTKVIVMTGTSRNEVVKYMDTGVVDNWIFKPFDMRHLGEVLAEFIPSGILSSLR